MASVISIFNNKGGVSKTTTCFNLAWILANRGNKVVIVDADPQCNLTGMVLGLSQGGGLDDFYSENIGRNIMTALEPAFLSRPRPLEPVDCIGVEGCDGLWLVPGHVGLAEYDVSLGIAQQLSESLQALKNLPGSLRHLIDLTADRYDADYVLVDLSPSLGAINQNLVMTSDYFMVPTSPDVFSVMALSSLSRVLPRWESWARSASNIPALQDADYPFNAPGTKFLGVVTQRYRLRSGEPTEAFQKYIDDLDRTTRNVLRPALESCGLLLPVEKYEENGISESMRMASISDFNTLIANSTQARKPIFALDKNDVGKVGVVWDRQSENIAMFKEVFNSLAEKVEGLTH